MIVLGRVTAIASARDPSSGGLYTYVTLNIAEVVKGWVPERQIVLKQLGGRADGLGFAVPGQATFTEGEDALVFLEVRPRDASLYTAALWQGKWSVATGETGQQVARRTDPAVSTRQFRSAFEERPLTEFLTGLRRLVGNAARQPTGLMANTRPLETPSAPPAGRTQQAYTLLGPARWFEADVNVPVRADMHSVGQAGLGGGGTLEIAAALALWTNAGSALRLTGGLLRGPRCLAQFDGDGRISISFNDPCGEISNSGATLAIGGGWFSEMETRVVNGQTFNRLIQGTIVLNDSPLALQFLTKSRCFQDIQTHELGHAVGLGHSSQAGAIMFPTIDDTCANAAGPAGASEYAGLTGQLGPDDLAGIRFIYPATSSTPPSAPSNLQSSVDGTTVRLTWNAPTAGGPVSTYVVEAGSTSGTSNLANFTTGSTATSYVAGGVPPGHYFVRVRARNAGGTSGASNEIMLTVQAPPCHVPGSPGTLGFTVSGSLVTLTWTAPSSGGAASAYLVEAGSGTGRADLAVFDTGSTATMFMAVAPPGTYFVRVRAKNACGVGGVSNEVVITVP